MPAWLGRQSLADAVREQIIVFVGSVADVRSLITCVGVDRYTELVSEPA